MTGKNKNIRAEHSRFLNYRKGGMSGSERNSFERDLQKDPFSEEAAEGFDLLSPEEMGNDLARLSGKIRARSGKKRNFVFYRIAASVAVLMIISSIFLVVERRNRTAAPALAEMQQVPLSVYRSEPVKPAPETSEQAHPRQEKETAKKELNTAAEDQIPEKPTGAAAIPPAPEQILPEIKAPAENKAAADESVRITGAVAERSVRKSELTPVVLGKVISTEDSMPLAGASVMIKGTRQGAITDANGNFSLEMPEKKNPTLVAASIGMKPAEIPATAGKPVEIALQPDVASLDEVVVTGYGVSRARDEETSEYTSPQPVNGRAAFNRYIEANIHRPDSATSGQRAVVVARLNILADGSIGEIKILRTPGEEFSTEAMRLIKAGPAWNPASRNRVAVEDSVTLRIVFK